MTTPNAGRTTEVVICALSLGFLLALGSALFGYHFAVLDRRVAFNQEINTAQANSIKDLERIFKDMDTQIVHLKGRVLILEEELITRRTPVRR